jgi:OOP family OmpA-OmpF porin
MKTHVFVRVLTLLILAFFLSADAAHAQFIKRLGRAAKEAAERKVTEKVVEKEEEAIEQVFEGGAEAEAEEEEAEESSSVSNEATETVSGGTAAADPAAAAPKRAKPGEGAWANYDFVPGERVIFAEDFSKDRVGNFPQRFEFISGNAEVVEWEGRKWLRMNEETFFKIPLPENLPNRFTVEFDATIPWWGMDFHADAIVGERYNHHVYETSGVVLGCCEVGVYKGKGEGVSSVDARDHFKDMFSEHDMSYPMRVRLHVDGNYVKMYLEEKRVANLPNGNFGRQNYLAFRMSGSADEAKAPLITNFSINAGGTPMYDALMTDGRFATQGILFDTGSDVIRPESTPTLKEIASMLKDHADLRLLIEGHTDNTGNADANQALSERRAAAVKQYLVESEGIDGSRLETKGFGPSVPVADNATPEGRQQNRRVELVKL